MSLMIVNRSTIIVNSLSELQANTQYIRPGNIYFVAGSPWDIYVCFSGTTLTKIASSTSAPFPSTGFIAYTPTVTPQAGTFGSATLEAGYLPVGKIVFFRISYSATLSGSNATNVTFDTPVGYDPLSTLSNFQGCSGSLQLVSAAAVNYSAINKTSKKIFMVASFTQVAMSIILQGFYEIA